MKNIIIIAEAGVNHNGDIKLAKQLIDIAADAGADYVKFQTFKAEKIVSANAKKAIYQKNNMPNDASDSQLDMLKKLELTKENHLELIDYCNNKNIQFLSTAFDLESLDLLYKLGINLFKIPSGEITNLPLLKKIGALNKKVIVSTGMCVMTEIEDAVNVIVAAGTKRENITILHCTTDYPTHVQDVNLNAMLSIQKQLGLNIGYSDHTLGISVPIAAVAMGATIIEKHFTTNKNLIGPDHKASLEPQELKEMIRSIRDIEKALGSSVKEPTDNEKKNMLVARKSIHLAKSLLKGDILYEENIITKRPGDGISPMQMENVIGKMLTSDLPADHKLNWVDII